MLKAEPRGRLGELTERRSRFRSSGGGAGGRSGGVEEWRKRGEGEKNSESEILAAVFISLRHLGSRRAVWLRG